MDPIVELVNNINGDNIVVTRYSTLSSCVQIKNISHRGIA